MVFCSFMVKMYYLATHVLEEITVKCNSKCFLCFLLFLKLVTLSISIQIVFHTKFLLRISTAEL